MSSSLITDYQRSSPHVLRFGSSTPLVQNSGYVVTQASHFPAGARAQLRSSNVDLYQQQHIATTSCSTCACPPHYCTRLACGVRVLGSIRCGAGVDCLLIFPKPTSISHTTNFLRHRSWQALVSAVAGSGNLLGTVPVMVMTYLGGMAPLWHILLSFSRPRDSLVHTTTQQVWRVL